MLLFNSLYLYKNTCAEIFVRRPLWVNWLSFSSKRSNICKLRDSNAFVSCCSFPLFGMTAERLYRSSICRHTKKINITFSNDSLLRCLIHLCVQGSRFVLRVSTIEEIASGEHHLLPSLHNFPLILLFFCFDFLLIFDNDRYDNKARVILRNGGTTTGIEIKKERGTPNLKMAIFVFVTMCLLRSEIKTIIRSLSVVCLGLSWAIINFNLFGLMCKINGLKRFLIPLGKIIMLRMSTLTVLFVASENFNKMFKTKLIFAVNCHSD